MQSRGSDYICAAEARAEGSPARSAINRIGALSDMSSCSDPLCSRTAEMQPRAFIICHKIGLGLAWLEQELAAFGPSAFIICTRVATARKDAQGVETTVTSTERGNCIERM